VTTLTKYSETHFPDSERKSSIKKVQRIGKDAQGSGNKIIGGILKLLYHAYDASKWVCQMYDMQAQGIIATYFGFSAVPRNCSNSCSINRNQETALFSATNTHLPSAHTSHFLVKKVRYKIDNNWVHVKLYKVGNQATGELQSFSHQAIGTSQAHFGYELEDL
jgi:hypothetical protein